jgi:Fur family ferric uptake transcriptional regulator
VTEHSHPHEQAVDPTALRAPGRRQTRQREAIWSVLLAEPNTHLSAEDVAERVRAYLPRVNPSTVYRTLDLLVAEDLVLRTDLGAGRAYYEPSHDHPHHHLVCEQCGSVTHIHDEALGDLARQVDRSVGFAIGNRELTIFGLCRGCRTAE